MNQSLTLAFLIAAGIGLVVQNTLMVRITQTSSTILIAMLLNSLVGIVLFVSILWFKQGMAGFGELVSSVRWWTLIPGLLGSFFVFASISGYQNVGAATTIAVLVASQLIGGLVLDIFNRHTVMYVKVADNLRYVCQIYLLIDRIERLDDGIHDFIQ